MCMSVSITHTGVSELAFENTIYISPSSRVMLPLHARFIPVSLAESVFVDNPFEKFVTGNLSPPPSVRNTCEEREKVGEHDIHDGTKEARERGKADSFHARSMYGACAIR